MVFFRLQLKVAVVARLNGKRFDKDKGQRSFDFPLANVYSSLVLMPS